MGVLPDRRAERLEAELPFALRGIAAQLSMGVSFEEALRSAAAGEGPLAAEFAAACAEIDSGAGVPEALRRMGERCGSLAMRRAVAMLVACYEHGGKGEELRKLARETGVMQRARERERAARASMLGLGFLAVGCVVPALFLAYVTVGSAFAETLPADAIWLVFVLVFPLLDAVAIGLVLLLAPTPPLRGAEMFSKREMNGIWKELARMGVRADFRKLAMVELAMALSAPILYYYTGDAALALLAVAAPAIAYLALAHLAARREADMERMLPDALFHAASLPAGTGFERVIESLADPSYGALGEEFARIAGRIRAGVGMASALELSARGVGSRLLGHSLRLLTLAYRSGAELSQVLIETAEDALEEGAALAERRSSLALQRYTMLAGGALLVPFILGTVAHVVEALDLGGGLLENSAEAVAAGVGAGRIYLLIFALLSSTFIALQEGEPRKLALYAILSAPLSLAVFELARGGLAVFI